ncbi:hypothetical protein ABPG77_006034 [Micractinium sp. CCAP 211/92]
MPQTQTRGSTHGSSSARLSSTAGAHADRQPGPRQFRSPQLLAVCPWRSCPLKQPLVEMPGTPLHGRGTLCSGPGLSLAPPPTCQSVAGCSRQAGQCAAWWRPRRCKTTTIIRDTQQHQQCWPTLRGAARMSVAVVGGVAQESKAATWAREHAHEASAAAQQRLQAQQGQAAAKLGEAAATARRAELGTHSGAPLAAVINETVA